jgi:tetratricopeptide (TPR) repeat protein
MEAALADPDAHGAEAVRQALRDLVHRSLLMRAKEDDHRQFTHVLGYRFARKEIGSDPATRTGLGRWLHTRLAADLAAGKPQSIGDALEHLGALLRADNDQRLWYPLAYDALYKFTDRLNDLGGLVQVKLLLSAVAGWLERFPPDKAREPYWRRERSVLADRQADVLQAQGDLSGALAAYRDSLQIARQLATADPSNAEWQRDLSLSFMRMTVWYAQAGDRNEALRFAQESLTIGERLAALDRSNASWQKDVAYSRALVARLRG